ncbi:hypothetical protein [Salinibacter sp.]|uniref:hypothetical protein n=1 Tax=Salinibacter sp. TaxID=2065818 RepID=UPI0021E8CC10|nr:hypothetical protein [Salinibacter sp.]
MPEEAAIQFYKITRCGYYEYYSTTPEFGSIDGTFSTLTEWAEDEDKELRATRLFDPEEGSNIRPTYCYDVQRSQQSGNYLLTTWNQTPSSDGQFASVQADAPVGEAEVKLTDVPDDTIPGYATYFWLVPDEKLLATVQFQHRVANGKPGLEKYINTFLAKHHEDHVAWSEDGDADVEVSGYQRTPDAEIRDIYPRFRTETVRPPGKTDFIKSNRERISKVIRKTSLEGETVANTSVSVTQTLLSLLGTGSGSHTPDSIRTRYELSFEPSEGQLESIIENWEQNKKDNSWNDIGFKMTGDSKVYWLSHSISRYEETLDVSRLNDEVVSPESVLAELDSQQADLIARIPEAEIQSEPTAISHQPS